MPRAVAIHPAYESLCGGSFFSPTAEDLSNMQAFRAKVNDHIASSISSLPDAVEKNGVFDIAGRQMELSMVRPVGTENENLPAVIYCHGGGFMFGNKATYAKIIRDIANEARVAVLFPDYVLAPEAVFPAAVEECYAVLLWVVDHGAEINVDPTKLAVCGDGAGGNLSAAVSLMAKDRLEVPADTIKTEILIYPSLTGLSETAFESYRQFGAHGEYALSFADSKIACDLYSGRQSASLNDNKYRFPLVASKDELYGAPPCLMIVSEADVLRDEGEAYARKLLEAGVATTSVRINATTHGFLQCPVEAPPYRQTLALITSQLNEAFGR